jgi:ubiquinone/menaquinone biosynthesis C-methylase UbiE
VARVDYDRQAERYQVGRQVPLETFAAWRDAIGRFLPERTDLILDLGAGTGIWTYALASWFDKPVIGVEPSEGMRKVAQAQGLEPNMCLVAGRAEAIPLGSGTCSVAWLATVVHHFDDLRLCAAELRRVLTPGGRVLIRNSFPHRHDEIMLFRFFEAARRVANTFPTVEEVIDAFATVGFEMLDLVRVHEPAYPSLQAIRDWAVSMRHTDSTLAAVSDEEFAHGLVAIDLAIVDGELPIPIGLDLLVLV